MNYSDSANFDENPEFLTTQIITYLGNKRRLLEHIEKEILLIAEKLNCQKLVCADLFSGSGIVARMLKKYSSNLIVNDLENYSAVINGCYLINKKDFPVQEYSALKGKIEGLCSIEKIPGIISQNYAPQNDKDRNDVFKKMICTRPLSCIY